ncbi:MAG: polyketide synthase, partial [Acidobacteria bacterium]|nr:polyketide synthase [Acidobacteriota bacterium]
MDLLGKNTYTGLEIAVIGMAGKFPGAKSINELWENLKNGVESISFFTHEELLESGVDPQSLQFPDYVKAKGILDDIECFDSTFFGYTAVEAQLMDPQTRVFHECIWHALEDASYVPGNYQGKIGLYAGASCHLKWEVAAKLSEQTGMIGDFNARQLFDKDFMTTRVSYCLNLSGPSVSIYTACSTSLVAIHMASQGLLSGECKIALAGGVSISLPQKTGYLYREGMVSASDGHCKTFDAAADGTVTGEGVGVVVLKLLENALTDRDHIHGVIKSTAVNNDGKNKVGYTAPSIKGQATVIQNALRAGRVAPESIGYIEAHGTGTNLGDPTEIESLVQAFNTNKKEYCGIGSIKSNIGHTDCAAGVVGFIKAILA